MPYNVVMPLPGGLKSHAVAIGWIAFAILVLPILVFAFGLAFSDGFMLDRVAVAAVEIGVVGITSWLLGYGLSRGRVALVIAALILVVLILVVYAAVISLLTGGLKIKIF